MNNISAHIWEISPENFKQQLKISIKNKHTGTSIYRYKHSRACMYTCSSINLFMNLHPQQNVFVARCYFIYTHVHCIFFQILHFLKIFARLCSNWKTYESLHNITIILYTTYIISFQQDYNKNSDSIAEFFILFI